MCTFFFFKRRSTHHLNSYFTEIFLQNTLLTYSAQESDKNKLVAKHPIRAYRMHFVNLIPSRRVYSILSISLI